MRHVKFYSTTDMTTVLSLRSAFEISKAFDDTQKDYSINEVLEFYNIWLFINKGLVLKDWSKEDIQEINKKAKTMKSLTFKYFALIPNSDIFELYKKSENRYKEDYWCLLTKTKRHTSISNSEFAQFLSKARPNISLILRNNVLVSYFDLPIKQFLLENPENAEILLDKFETQNLMNTNLINLPTSLTIEEKEQILIHYINSVFPNFNYLKLICNIQSNPTQLCISDRTRLLAIKKVNEIETKMFNPETAVEYEFKVIFREQDDVVKEDVQPQKAIYSYDSKWIKSNLSYSDILMNFIYLFKFTDRQMRINLVNKQSEMNALERFVFFRSKKGYNPSFFYKHKDYISSMQMEGYINLLSELDIRIEDPISWFFTDLLSEEFDIQDFRIKMPSLRSTFFEKCRTILPEMESILKQFNLYIDDNDIDHELLQLSREHLLFKNCKSLNPKKYVYANSEVFFRATHLLFSDQPPLGYISQKYASFRNFYEIITYGHCAIEEIEDYQKHDLDWLLENKYISLDKNKIIFPDIIKISILRDIFNCEVINYNRCPLVFKQSIDKMIESGLLKFESTLFSIPEQKYLNYHLNLSSFNDSLDLRNKYSHGTQPTDDSEDYMHKSNYEIFLKLLILIIIKIYDDIFTAKTETP